MVFSSIEFLLYFLPCFMLVYLLTPKKLKNVTLVLGSLIFYSYGDLTWLALLALSVVVNFFVGQHLRGNKGLMVAAAGGNLAVLVFMKCVRWELGFPLGLSFYTFQTLSYLFDVYRKEIRAEKEFFRYAAYITGFMHVISGPILKYNEVSRELQSRRCNARTIQEGLKLFVLGLSAKVLLADRLGILWHEIQVTGFESISTPLAWLGALSYSMQLYFDFAGYSLMAIGLGRMIGFHLPENFRQPYMAKSVREFYRRWHMTLGRWFRQYVYIPLGGSRKGEAATIYNLVVVWLLTSVWHGSTWNYLIWGGFLLILIILERQISRLWKWKAPFICHLYLWIVIPVSWVCFAITDLSELQVYLCRMFGLTPAEITAPMDWQRALGNYGVLFVLAFLSCTPLVRRLYEKLKDTWYGMLLLCILFWMCVAGIRAAGENVFLYFSY